MLSFLGRTVSKKGLGSLAAVNQAQQYRFLNVHEYQGAQLMAKFGINVPPGIPAKSIEEVEKAVPQMADEKGEVVIKSQILAGGRGLGKFTNGLQGGVHIVGQEKAIELAKKMLGGTLVTKQSGAEGKPVNTLYIAKKMKLKREMYFAILLDRKSAGPILIGCSEGGTSIEDLAEKFPEKIVKIPIDIRVGITDAQALQMVEGLQVTGDKAAAAEQIKGLYSLFTKADCTMVEVNPLAEDINGNLVAADAKLGFDDNAYFRQKEIFEMKDDSQIDSREVAAAKFDLNYIGLDGEIGCLVNGAGLAMATMDIIKLSGGSPANFLDVGGNASEGQVVEAFKILTGDKRVKAILVNIFGGIMKCDVIASGIVNAAKQVGVQVPLIVRLEGTNVEQGKEIIKSSGLTIITADDLDDAAKKAVASIKN
uniref:Succinate--CoA ligase [ADP-forming] subunit beta, mitochondrial n=1 Tax=Polytomella sp. Pringsheim 198.80 TaxID=37502 RepID=A0A024FS87_9CHLO|nr:succinate-CoA ligase [ADP-forming] subunit beta (SUCLA2) [Polytomella parva]CBM40836.1 succinyl-CoA ligase, beta subunit [Polytomella sp. Pringsheim 198.80]|mmetsp:Transcript_13497/g.23872  ORF Transcript_13497/g.23872 Transcript_13497/m.23872 type:complete len:423 (-) Transcript_13497:151-1419(-)|eukprot:CAMPEP_0175056748 /NCGR_PEP_ID=MMETSP0052_2-20121109/10860_1 /TAXON_ID=51329 ORGANISM="Polytomella parva, Strain SAG 63-3" /NCGR_SAMPLE_ID=MMETSP0052_2 /ASSEMBLY_ACC=CAM_ASM_000194 /LENGTH=422 /DNA_ID=CAMNT_0016321843 /DNA_START=182 /DNA_END=1450 /DNA_ORIENTATION=+